MDFVEWVLVNTMIPAFQNHTEACKLKLAKVPFCTSSFFLSFFLSSLFRRASTSIVRATAFIFGRSTPFGLN